MICVQSERLKEILNIGKVSAFLGILSQSDEEAYNHSVAVAELVDEYLHLAKERNELVWTESECDEILIGTLLHDIGKGFLPFGLQYCSRELTSIEFEIIKTHSLLGMAAIQNCDFSEIVRNIILMHHANADGSGYPCVGGIGFDEKSVPEYVWIVSYADRFDAMTNTRSFKKAKSYPEAWKELLNMSKHSKLPYKYTRLFGEIVKKKTILPIIQTKGDETNESIN